MGLTFLPILVNDTNLNCAILLATDTSGWWPWFCQGDSGAQCPCEKESPIYLKLRGLCPSSNIDKFYYPKNIDEKFVYLGITSTTVKYNYASQRWDMDVSSKAEKTTGSSGKSFGSFLLGKIC